MDIEGGDGRRARTDGFDKEAIRAITPLKTDRYAAWPGDIPNHNGVDLLPDGAPQAAAAGDLGPSGEMSAPGFAVTISACIPLVRSTE